MSASYGMPAAPYPAMWSRPPSASTASTLVLIALILQCIAGAFVLGLVLLILGATAFAPFPFAWVGAVVALTIAAVTVIFLYFAYEYSYRRIQRGDYRGAETPTLVLGIVSLLLGVIPGILYIVAYLKIGDALNEMRMGAMPYGSAPPYGVPMPQPAPVHAQVACRGCGRVYVAGQFGFCPGCGAPLGS